MQKKNIPSILFFPFVLSPAIFLIFIIMKYAVSLPVMDDWVIGKFIYKATTEGFSISDLLEQANESREFFPRLIFYLISKLFYWDVRFQMGFTFILACIISFNIFKLSVATVKGNSIQQLTLIFFANILIFSPLQYQNWLWGIQSIVFIPMVCLSTALIVLYSSLSLNIKIFISIMLSTIATFSYANGMICWLLLLPFILNELSRTSKNNTLLLIFYVSCMLFNYILYFIDYNKPPYHPPLDYVFYHPLDAIMYFFTFIGSSVGAGSFNEPLLLSIVFGVILVSVFVMFSTIILKSISKNDIFHNSFPWLLIGGYSLGSALLTTIGRSGFGAIVQALDSRYITFSTYLPVSLLFLGAIIYKHKKNHLTDYSISRRYYMLFLPVISLAIFIFATIHSIKIMDIRKQYYVAGRAYMTLSLIMPHQFLREIVYPEIGLIQSLLPKMEEKKIIRLPLLKSLNIRNIIGEIPEPYSSCGRIIDIKKMPEGHYSVKGLAFLPWKNEPAHAIFLTYDSELGNPILINYLVDPYDIKNLFSDMEGNKYKKWEIFFSPKQIPGRSVKISAWAFDTFSGKAFPLDNSIIVDIN